MTDELLLRLQEEIPRIEARRTLIAARGAGAPYQKREWWDDLIERTRGAVERMADQPLITFNGTPLSINSARKKLGDLFGDGFK